LSNLFTLNLRGRVGYGDGYGDTNDLPIYEKYTAGGVRSVRGYEFNTLGPRDSEGDAEGGNLQVITSAEIFFPIEALASSDTFRLGLYFDAGNVFENVEDYETSELRQAVGISAKWFSVIGPLEFSYAFPLNDESDDDVQPFQFALGAAF
jgi:outer membrane protein insertion porin family